MKKNRVNYKKIEFATTTAPKVTKLMLENSYSSENIQAALDAIRKARIVREILEKEGLSTKVGSDVNNEGFREENKG